jgi:hypothetical protein
VAAPSDRAAGFLRGFSGFFGGRAMSGWTGCF